MIIKMRNKENNLTITFTEHLNRDISFDHLYFMIIEPPLQPENKFYSKEYKKNSNSLIME